jgi:hypothetical protein
VSLKCSAAPIDWNEVQALMEASYRQIAPVRLANQLIESKRF